MKDMNIINKIIAFFKPKEWMLVEYPKKSKRKLLFLFTFLVFNFFFWQIIATLIPIIPYLIMLFLDYQAIKIFVQFKKMIIMCWKISLDISFIVISYMMRK